jgi:hypothetical protein
LQGNTGNSGPQGTQGNQGNTGSTGNQGPQGNKGPDGSQGDKYAIVPLHGGKDDYVGLFCAEMPESRFFDLYDVSNIDEGSHLVCRLDHRFIDVCVPGSIVPVSVAPNRPCQVGVAVKDGGIWMDIVASTHGVPTRLTVTVSGIRRGKKGDRFPAFKADTAQRNRAFWSQAYEPGTD